jgi:DNA helicase-2/ATP-dependent DNA helicase PcrA
VEYSHTSELVETHIPSNVDSGIKLEDCITIKEENRTLNSVDIIAEQRANYYYKLLIDNFRDANLWRDKSRQLRAIVEKLFCELVNIETISLNDAINLYFTQVDCPSVLKDTSHILRQRLNDIVHDVEDITEDRFMLFYDAAIRIICIIFKVEPSLEVRKTLGLTNDPYLELNIRQREVVLCNDKIINVNAGPGTGKTRLISYKILHYINSSSSTNLEKIVALSFTNNAARELRTRFSSLETMISLDKSDQYDLYFGTIHKYCLYIIKQYYKQQFDYQIVDDDEFRVLQQQESGVSWRELRDIYKVLPIKGILDVFKELLDYEDFKQWIKNKITTIIIDESQDLSEVVYNIIDRLLLVIPNLKMLLVGDPRQNIFGFLSGSYQNLQSFLQNREYTEKTLNLCYRCPKAVLDLANRLFPETPNLRLQAANIGRTDAVNRISRQYISEEVEVVIENIKRFCADGNYSKCAILTGATSTLIPFLDKLNEENIPFRVCGGGKKVKESIKTYNYIVQVVLGEKDRPYPRRKIAERFGMSFRLTKESFYNTELGRQIFNIQKQYHDQDTLSKYDALCAIKHLLLQKHIGIAQEFDDLINLILGYDTIEEYMSAFALGRDQYEAFYEKATPTSSAGGNSYVVASTIHSAKGLEWDYVFLVGATDEEFSSTTKRKDMILWNEEKRKMYVAITRAGKQLYITDSEKDNKGQIKHPSSVLPKLKKIKLKV